MFNISSASPLERPSRSGRDNRRRGFSLVEVVIATAIVSVALISTLGVMSLSLVSHQDASVDTSIITMADAGLQELRNVGFSQLTKDGGTYYVYFDSNGQLISDAAGASYQNATGSSGSTAGTPYLNTPPAPTSLPATSYYQCQMVLQQPTLPNATVPSESIVLVTMNFTWPVGPSANPNTSSLRTRTIAGSLTNPH